MKPPTTTAPIPIYWMRTDPEVCDLCHRPLGNTFVDGATKPQGRCGVLDLRCHREHGVGRGQLYRRQGDGRWLQTEG